MTIYQAFAVLETHIRNMPNSQLKFKAADALTIVGCSLRIITLDRAVIPTARSTPAAGRPTPGPAANTSRCKR
jgi:hypothetical protein